MEEIGSFPRVGILEVFPAPPNVGMEVGVGYPIVLIGPASNFAGSSHGNLFGAFFSSTGTAIG